MEILLTVIGFAIVGLLGFLVYRSSVQQKPEPDSRLMLEYIEALRKEIRESGTSNVRQIQDNRKEIQEKLDNIQDRLAKGLEHSSTTIQKQFSQSAKIIQEITGELSKVKETNKQVLNFSEKLQSLEKILTNPKQRGILGEYFLETLLGHVLQPNQYKIQYKFSNGEMVDAAIFYKELIIPIDAKFSLEKYNKIIEEKDDKRKEELEKEFKMDIKNRIDETSKYIRPKEHTTDFAFMFIPAEGIYYNLLVYKVGNIDVNAHDLIEYAFKKHVIIVSPTSFFAYLQTVIQGLKSIKMEESMEKIKQNVESLAKHLISYEVYMQKMGNNLGTTVNMYNSAYKEFNKIDKDIYRITDGEHGGKAEPILIDKPSVEA